jgi:hypothetical protein
MIQPNELRVGNLLRWEDDSHDIVRVESLHFVKDEPLPMTGMDLSPKAEWCIDYSETSRKESGCALLSEFIPVAVTAELIKCFGFEAYTETRLMFRKMYAETMTQKYWFKLDMDVSGKYATTNHAVIHGLKIKYLHQLQNLYYSLTGKELVYEAR